MTSADTSAHTRPLFGAQPCALLALADGTVFHGRAIGATGHAVGEVVFNTAMTGYQEIITDPSYAGQIVTLHAFRRDELAEHAVELGPPPLDTCFLTLLDAVGEDVAARRKAWLGA